MPVASWFVVVAATQNKASGLRYQRDHCSKLGISSAEENETGMATVAALSSFVARGAVGLRAIVPALERMGHEVVALPTIVLSNHPRHVQCAGNPVAPAVLADMVAALDTNGWLAEVDAVLTGYLPSVAHVAAAVDLIARVRTHRPQTLVVCDPVFGDDPGGLFLGDEVAAAVRDRLLPLADVMKPNRFELSYLSGRPVTSPDDAVSAARSLARPVVLASSIPRGDRALANVIVTAGRAACDTVEREEGVPRGTGDLLGALLTGHLAAGHDAFESAARAASGVRRMVAASRGHAELQLANAEAWRPSDVLPLKEIAG
jgi:pyridoxine kinase